MFIRFETCERSTALRYLAQFYPNHIIEDTPDCAGPLLDFVARDVIRIPDPMMHPNGAVCPSKNWNDEMKADVLTAFATLKGGMKPAPVTLSNTEE